MLAAFAGVQSASAQGVDHYFPPPINSDDLERYVELLTLAPHQRAALEDPFEQYQSDCSAVRQDEVAQFIADRDSQWKDPELDGRTRRQFLRRCMTLRSRLATMDDQFFFVMEETLGDGVTTESIQRLKLLRQRAIALAPIRRSSGVTHEIEIDLTQLVRRVETSEEERSALESIIIGYEAALTPSLNRLAQMIIERYFVLADPEDYTRQRIRIIHRAIDVIDLNRRWLKTMVATISSEAGQQLRAAYQRAAYPGLVPDYMGAHRTFAAAMELHDLTDDQRAALAAQRDAYVAEHAAITERLIQIVDRLRREPNFWRSMRNSAVEQPAGVVEARQLEARRKTLNKQARELLTPHLGAARMQSIRVEMYTEVSGAMPIQPIRLPHVYPRFNSIKIANSTMGIGPSAGSPLAALTSPRSHPLISHDAVTTLLKQLDAAEAQRSAVLEHYDGYVRQVTARRRALGEELQDTEAAMWARGVDDSFQPASDQTIAMFRQSYDDAHTELKQLDEAMFDRLAVLAQTPQSQGALAAARGAHTRRFCLKGLRSRLWLAGYFVGGESQLLELDLIPMLTDIHPPVENAAQFAAIAQNYERRATDLAKERFVASTSAKILGERALAASFVVGERNYEFDLTAEGPAGDAFRRWCSELGAAQQQYYQLNTTTFDQLHALLDRQTAREFRHRYRLAAFPQETRDSTAMHETLEPAVRDSQLSGEQQERVLELQVEYIVKYEAIMQRLVSAVRPPSKLAHFQFDDAGYIVYHRESDQSRQREEIEAIQFERDELNAATQRRLADIRAGVNAADVD